MSDDKKDGTIAGSAAERLAQQRKELNLQTQPLEVIADLDWDVEDDGDGFTLPNAVPETTKPAAAEQPAQAVKKSSGTMMMSASEFSTALQNNSATADASGETAQDAAEEDTAESARGTMLISGAAVDEAVADIKAQVAQEAETTKNEVVEKATETVAEAKKAEPSTKSSGGTMLLSGAAMEEAMAAAKNVAKESDEDARPTASHQSVSEAKKAEPSTKSSGGTMLLSGAAMEEAMASVKQDAHTATEPVRESALRSETTSPVQSASLAEQQPQAPNWDENAQRQNAQWSDPGLTETDEQVPVKKNLVPIIVAAVVVIIVIVLLIKLLG